MSRQYEKFLIGQSRKFLLTAENWKDGTNRDEPGGTRLAGVVEESAGWGGHAAAGGQEDGGKRMMGGAKAHYDGIVAFSQTDFTEDLKKISVPVLVIHSQDDQIVPYVASGPPSAKLLKNGTLKTYKGFPHGMPTTEAATINSDLLAFFKL